MEAERKVRNGTESRERMRRRREDGREKGIGKMGRGNKKRENERRMRIYQFRGELD